MKRNLKTLAAGAFMLCAAAALFAQKNPKDLVDAKYYDELVKNGVVTVTRDDGSKGLLLLPKSDYADQVVGAMIPKEKKNFPFTYEALYLRSKKSLLETSNSSASTITIDDVSRVCRSVSKMQGMKYYSSTKKKECVLYDRAYMIASETDKSKIADKNIGNADGLVAYCIQNDASFGECRYKLGYHQTGDTMLAVFDNLDTLGIGPFKAVHPHKMTINILAIDCGEDILLYLCTDLDSVNYPGIKGQIVDSMSARMDAVYNWFIKQF